MNIATAEIYLNEYQKGKDGLHSVSIRVTYNRERRYYRTQQRISPEHYNLIFIEVGRLSPELRKTKAIIEEFKVKAQGVINDLRTGFSWERFEKVYKRKQGNGDNVISMLDERSKELRGEGRISTAVTIECTSNSLKKFIEGDKLLIAAINVSFLNKYERWMLAQNNSYTTIGIYLRNLRAIYNMAIQDGIVLADSYPFNKAGSRDKYQIPKGKNVKKAISLMEVGKIYHFQPRSEAEAKARDYWLFSYFCNGMNLKDVALLKYRDLDSKMISFIRSKTKNIKKGDPTIIRASILPQVNDIIERWGNKNKHPDNRVFPILKNNSNPEETYVSVQLLVAFVNKYMKRIATELEIEKSLSSYVARHTFSSVLKRSGKSAEQIGEQLGHSDIKTTQNYLASLEEDAVHEMANELTKYTIAKAG